MKTLNTYNRIRRIMPFISMATAWRMAFKLHN